MNLEDADKLSNDQLKDIFKGVIELALVGEMIGSKGLVEGQFSRINKSGWYTHESEVKELSLNFDEEMGEGFDINYELQNGQIFPLESCPLVRLTRMPTPLETPLGQLFASTFEMHGKFVAGFELDGNVHLFTDIPCEYEPKALRIAGLICIAVRLSTA